ncbi:hypothetical protein Poly30_30810 [Planctomycetes bacterium Poly30]|uniref:Uncharacterized protein n=1 Tax=Saltatorellus ferox TaxID=2528018 RepID=A0A518EU05_9BACT|nr:hypothetical protein Poly30_30810 [Planctomycetes bacterium Poly30]
MATTSTFALPGLLLLVAAPLSGGSSGALQEKPQEFFYRRPIQKALGVTVKETHDLLLMSLTTQFGEADPVPSTVAMRLRTRMDSAMAEEAVDTGEGPGAMRRRYLAHEGEIQVIDPGSVDEVAGTWNGVTIALKSPLEGTSVAFVPADAQPGGFGRHFDALALRESALPKLSAPTDWSRYLKPADADGKHMIALGDQWTLDIALLEPLLAPAGFLGWRTEKPKEGEEKRESDQQILRAFTSGVGGNLQLGFDGEVSGTAEARLQTVGVDPDNGRYGQIQIDFDLTFRADREDFVDARRLEEDGEMDVEVLGGELEVGVKGVAFVNWGLALGRPFSCLVTGEESVVMTVRVLPPDSQNVVSQAMSMKGGLAHGLTFKELDLQPVKRTVVTGDR